MLAALVFLALLFLAWLIGALVMRRLGLQAFAWPNTVFRLPIGLGVLSYVIFLGGLVGLFPLTIRAVSIVAMILMAVVIVLQAVFARDVYAVLLRSAARWRPDLLTSMLALVILGLAFLTLTGALAPPTSNEWDALAYHLAVPKVWLHDGRIHPIPYDHHSNFPMLTEMLFSVGMAWKSVAMAKAFHWLFGLLGALACYWAGREWVSPKAGLLAAALYLAAPVVAWEATTAYIDLASTVYAVLAVFAFIKWLEAPEESASRRNDGWLYLAGIMAGFAAGTKMTMVATSGLLVLWAFGCAILKRPGSVRWKHVGILAGLALLIGSPWYVKTWLWTGNPVYPFAYGLLDGKWWSAQAAAAYAAEQARFGIGRSLWALWVAPWTTTFFAHYYANPPATFTGALQDAGMPQVFPAVFGSLGLGAIAFLPLWLLAPGVRRRGAASTGNGALPAMVLYSGAFLLVWFALTHQTRYLMVLLPLLLVPAVAGIRDFRHAGAGWRWATGVVAAIALLWGIIPAWVLARPAMAVAWVGGSADAYLSAREPIYVVSRRINAELPRNAKILMLQEVRGFYLDRPYQWGNPEQNALIPWDKLADPAAMDRVLRAKGITHVLVNWSALPPDAPPPWVRLAAAAAAQGLWTPVIVTGPDPQRGITVYRVSSG